MSRMREGRTDNRTREDRATQPMGCWRLSLPNGDRDPDVSQMFSQLDARDGPLADLPEHKMTSCCVL